MFSQTWQSSGSVRLMKNSLSHTIKIKMIGTEHFTRRRKEEGDMGVYGIAVLGFFSCGISVILILTCGIAVSSSAAVCSFSSFWLTVLGE